MQGFFVGGGKDRRGRRSLQRVFGSAEEGIGCGGLQILQDGNLWDGFGTGAIKEAKALAQQFQRLELAGQLHRGFLFIAAGTEGKALQLLQHPLAHGQLVRLDQRLLHRVTVQQPVSYRPGAAFPVAHTPCRRGGIVILLVFPEELFLFRCHGARVSPSARAVCRSRKQRQC